MKILLYSHHFAPSVGGVERVVDSLASGFAKRGHLVTVVTAIGAGSFDDGVLPYRVVRRPKLLALLQLIREHDITHLAGPAMAPLLLGWLMGRRVVMEHHGFQVICPSGQLYYEPADNFCPGHFMAGRYRECLRCNASQEGRIQSARMWLLTFPRRWLCHRVERHIMPTEWLSSLLQLSPAVTIHHGLGRADKAGMPAAEPAPPVFVFLGRLVSTKGVRVLLEAASLLRKEGCGLQLKIIGGGPDRERLAGMTRTLGLRDSVSFVGALSDEKLDEALSGVRAVIVPSLAGEVFGMVAAEQMKRGRAVIVSDLGALREVVGDGGLIFPAGDARALAAHMKGLIEDPELARRLGEKALRRAEEMFDDEQMIGQHLRLYQEVLENKIPDARKASLKSAGPRGIPK